MENFLHILDCGLRDHFLRKFTRRNLMRDIAQQLKSREGMGFCNRLSNQTLTKS